MARRVAVRGMVLFGGRLLCVRLKQYEGSIRTDETSYWCLPGGGLEDHEGLVDGVTREMIEETGIAPAVGDLLYVQQFAHGEHEYLEFFFHITNAADYLSIDLSNTSHGEKEIAEIAFVDPKATHILPKFLTTEDLAAHAAGGQAPKIFSLL